MIAEHPEIFSSFYSVPLPFLEREFLKELRDFLLSGMRAFRRLLLGLHQDSGDVVDVFQQWQEWRTKNGVHFPNGARTVYYAQGGFPADFLRFVRLHYIPASRAPLAMTTLVEYEAALLGRDHESHIDGVRHPQEQVSGDGSGDSSDEIEDLLSPDSRLQLLPGVHVIRVPADYQEIVRRLQQRSPLNDLPGQPVKLVIRRTAPGPVEVRQLSPLSAELLGLCEARLTVKEIAAEFLQRKIEVPGIPADKACLAGIEILRQQRLIGLLSKGVNEFKREGQTASAFPVALD
jgi:hypothetical protein